VEHADACNTAADAAHLCAVSVEYELLCTSKLPVSYKAAVMKRVNEIKKLNGQRELYAALVAHITDKRVIEATTVEQTSTTSVESLSPVEDAYIADAAADDDEKVVPNADCDNDNIAKSCLSQHLSFPKKDFESCDSIRSSNVQQLHNGAESDSTVVASDRNADFSDDRDCMKDAFSNRCGSLSHDADLSSELLVKQESIAADALSYDDCDALRTRKSVHISASPPTVHYIDRQHAEVRYDVSNTIVKVVLHFCLIISCCGNKQAKHNVVQYS